MVVCVCGCIVAPPGGRGGGSDPVDQIGDGVGDGSGTAPLHGGTMHGAHPDHALLSPLLSDAVGVTHVGCPHATVLIKLAPCGGLDCDGVGHWSFAVETIIRGRGRGVPP